MSENNLLTELAARCRASSEANSDLDKEVLYALFRTQGWRAWASGIRPTSNKSDALTLLTATFETNPPSIPKDATPSQICALILDTKAALPSVQ